MPVARSCDDCIFLRPFDGKETCLRHSPGLSDEKNSVAYWPPPPSARRCGYGVSRTKDPADGEPSLTPCVRCFHHYKPDGKPIDPGFTGRKTRDWWSRSGYCTLAAPRPSNAPHRKVYSIATHETDGCGDGARMED